MDGLATIRWKTTQLVRRRYGPRVLQRAMLISGMSFPAKYRAFMMIPVLALAMETTLSAAAGAAQDQAQQNSPSAQPSSPQSSILDRLNSMISGGKSAWSPDQLATMERLRDAALRDPYALNQLRHLTDNIGPRLSGSPQAQQAVNYVA